MAVVWSDPASGRDGMCIDVLGKAKGWVKCNRDWTDGYTIYWSFRYDTANGWEPEDETFRTVV